MPDTSDHPQSAVMALQYLLKEYGTVEKIPQNLLTKNGFVSAQDAHNALNKGQGTGFTLGDLGKQVTGAFVHNTMPVVSNFTGLPNVAQAINQPPPSNAVPTTQEVASHKDDYADQYANLPGSGLRDVTPIPGGVQYGTAANGSLAVPSGTGAASSFQPSDAPNYSDYINNIGSGNWDYADIPVAPSPFQFKITDFTPQAQADANTAYSPAFAAVDLAKKNAQNNYNVASAVTGGIYSALNGQIGANASDLDKKYAAAALATQADTKAAQNSVSGANNAAAVALRNQMSKMGMGNDLAATFNNPQAQDAAAAQAAMAQTGLDDTTANRQYNLSADTHNTGLQNAAATQGAYATQGLAQDLASTLSGYDQNKLQISSDEALKVLDLAQQLSGQDMSLQQLQAGAQQTYYGQQLSAANAQNSLASQQQQQLIDQANQNYQNAYNQWKDTTGFQMDAQKEADSQSQFNAGLSKDIQVAQIGAGGSAAAQKAASTGPYGDFANQVFNIVSPTGGNPTDYINGVNALIQKYVTQNNKPGDEIQFMQDAIQFATQHGLDPALMQAAASSAYGSGILSGWNTAKQLGSTSSGG